MIQARFCGGSCTGPRGFLLDKVFVPQDAELLDALGGGRGAAALGAEDVLQTSGGPGSNKSVSG